jgi:hypothetical protein
VTDQRDGPNPAFFSLSGTSVVVLSTASRAARSRTSPAPVLEGEGLMERPHGQMVMREIVEDYLTA